jgi:asparagine synthase (glutamine-hydrolysing)
MCGIAGYLHFDKDRNASADVLRRMTNILHRRGPDGEGFYVNRNVALGHRRLAIIDLNTGGQPMYNDNGKVVVIFNGEIYNYIELREELVHLGQHFKTESDTEVIVRAYEVWGIDSQKKFNGMWAFALWDEARKQLFLSCDRLGEKPLHYAIWKDTLVFGSEIKSILAFGLAKEVNVEVLELYLSLGYVPAPYSFYKHVRKLLPGHYLIAKGSSVQEHLYWDLPQVDEADMLMDKPKVRETFENLLVDSVRIRMRSDVPYGAFLSGGLDSSSLVAVMSQNSDHPVETFTIGFSDNAFDERPLAREVAAKFRCKHHERTVEIGTFEESLDAVLYSFDEPFGDSSAIPTGRVSKAARESVKMAITGDGGDEVLSGYTSYQGERFSSHYQRVPGPLRTAIYRGVRGIQPVVTGKVRYKVNRISSVLGSANEPFGRRFIAKACWTDPRLLAGVLRDLSGALRMEDYLNELLKGCRYTDDFYKRMYLDLKMSLPFDMLAKVDRMSMAHSLETRIPFLDYRLVEFMCRVRKDVKMEGYERKSILRNTVGKRLPPKLLKAPKKGFVVPLRGWFRDRSFSDRLSLLYITDFGLNSDAIRRIVNAHVQGELDSSNFIWMLFVLRRWLLR